MNQTLEMVLRQTATLTPDELAASLGRARARNLPLWDFLVLERQIPEDALANAFSKALNLPRVDIEATSVDAAALEAVAGWLAHKHTCLPIRFAGKALVLAMANPLDSTAIHDVQFASSRHVKPVVASRTDILTGIRRWYASTARARVEPDPPPEPDEACVFTVESPPAEQTRASDASTAVELCSQIMSDAITMGASDVHIEAGASETRVRLRIDGVLREYLHIPDWMRGALLSRIKVLAKLDIAEHRVPQDGRIQHQVQNQRIDVRVSTLPTQFGEKAVLRLLRSADTPALSALGFSDGEVTLLDEALHQPQGLILVTGPTGGGKSTTLHSMLARRQSREINIVTIEDPIEYQVAGATQVQVNVKAGVTFASCLRAVLRQDPDVIMVGEIRDKETAEIAFHAALTGHLVLSTLHTNSSIGAIARLIELGVKPTMLTAATNLIMAQRLARRICATCREPYTPTAEALGKLRLQADSWAFQHGRGCEACGGTGFSGRVGIFEILRLTPELKELVNRSSGERRLKRVTAGAGGRFLLDDALAKVRAGLTTIEELLRVIRIEPEDYVAWESQKLPVDHLLPAATARAAKPRKRTSKSKKPSRTSTGRRAAGVEGGGYSGRPVTDDRKH
jgi:type IV pilus assembly protein PilB